MQLSARDDPNTKPGPAEALQVSVPTLTPPCACAGANAATMPMHPKSPATKCILADILALLTGWTLGCLSLIFSSVTNTPGLLAEEDHAENRRFFAA